MHANALHRLGSMVGLKVIPVRFVMDLGHQKSGAIVPTRVDPPVAVCRSVAGCTHESQHFVGFRDELAFLVGIQVEAWNFKCSVRFVEFVGLLDVISAIAS